MPPQSLHWPEWEDLHNQQCWLENKNDVTGSLFMFAQVLLLVYIHKGYTILHMYLQLTDAHKSSRVWGPGPIW